MAQSKSLVVCSSIISYQTDTMFLPIAPTKRPTAIHQWFLTLTVANISKCYLLMILLKSPVVCSCYRQLLIRDTMLSAFCQQLHPNEQSQSTNGFIKFKLATRKYKNISVHFCELLTNLYFCVFKQMCQSRVMQFCSSECTSMQKRHKLFCLLQNIYST